MGLRARNKIVLTQTADVTGGSVIKWRLQLKQTVTYFGQNSFIVQCDHDAVGRAADAGAAGSLAGA